MDNRAEEVASEVLADVRFISAKFLNYEMTKDNLPNKRFFFVAASLVIGCTFVLLLICLHEAIMVKNPSAPKLPLKMALHFPKATSEFDPAKILVIEDYILTDNLFSRLVEYNTKGELVASVAASFKWHGDELVFSFSNKARTVDGQIIGAKDAELSLKRAVLYKRTGHGDIRNFLCPGMHLTSLNDVCPGIRIEGDQLILKPIKKNYGALLLTALEAADFSIIPIASLNPDPKNPTILNFRNTSGPYYVEKDDPNGAWILNANPNHFHFNQNMPQSIELAQSSIGDIGQLFIDKAIDIIPTSITLSEDTFGKILKDPKYYSVHQSLPINVFGLYFTPNAVREFTTKQRFYIGRVLTEAIFKMYNFPDMKPTEEFLQGLSDGSITEDQRIELRSLRKVQFPPFFQKPIKVAVLHKNIEKWQRALEDHSEIQFVGSDEVATTVPIEKRADVYFMNNDAAWTESLPLVEYNFSNHTFHLPNLKPKDWIQEYLDAEDKETRIAKLRDLHFQMLKNVVIYPIASGPYFAFAHKPWKLYLSPYAAGTELWRIRYEP